MKRAWTKSLWPILRENRAAGVRLACTVITPLLFANASSAGPALRIATWDVSQAEKSIFTRKKNEKKSSWRHTFGSERHDARKSRLGVFNLDVDVVLLQGVRNVRALRRVFPTRHWKLILSRDYMQYTPPLSRLPPDLQAYDIAAFEHGSKHPVTAVAVRYQRRLRVRAIKHIKIDDHVENIDADLPDTNLENVPSATAVRINHFGSNIWLMSLALTKGCKDEIATCSTWKATQNWYKLLRSIDQVPAVAGIAHASSANDGTEAQKATSCGTLAPLSQNCGTDTCLGKVKSLTRKKLGCIVLTTVHSPKAVPQHRALPLPDF